MFVSSTFVSTLCVARYQKYVFLDTIDVPIRIYIKHPVIYNVMFAQMVQSKERTSFTLWPCSSHTTYDVELRHHNCVRTPSNVCDVLPAHFPGLSRSLQILIQLHKVRQPYLLFFSLRFPSRYSDMFDRYVRCPQCVHGI